MTRRSIRRKARQMMRFAAYLTSYPGPIANGTRERVAADVRAWLAVLSEVVDGTEEAG